MFGGSNPVVCIHELSMLDMVTRRSNSFCTGAKNQQGFSLLESYLLLEGCRMVRLCCLTARMRYWLHVYR